MSAGLFGGNDQAELGSIELSSMTKTRLRRAVCLEFCACLLVFVCYLEFIIWCLTDILINSINKYFAKNGQKTFIKELMHNTKISIIIPLPGI
jgi:hypothetical protein